jgi:HEAT repeat protein
MWPRRAARAAGFVHSSCVRVALFALACALGSACGGGARGGPPPVLAPSGPRLPPPPAIDPGVRGAAYLTAVAAHIQPAWGQFLEDCRLRLPKQHPLNAPGLAAAAELAIARDGRVVKLAIAQGSGNGDFDRAVQQVLGDASPLPRPPSDLESDDEAVHLRWLFARDRRQAGPATARVLTVQLPLLGVVERLLERGAIARAAHRILQAPGADADRAAATERVMIAALREGLASTDGGVRRAAVDAVGRAGVQALAGQIQVLLVSAVDVDLRLAAIGAAAALGDPAAAAAILPDYRADLAGRPRVALEETAALVKLGRAAEVAAAIRAELEAAIADGARRGPFVPPGGTALAALALAPDPELAPRLVGWFQRGDARVRASVCTALPAAAPAQAAQLVGRGLRDPDAMVRAACAEAAGRAGGAPADPQLVRRLRELVRDPDRIVRARAVAALAIVDPGHRSRVLEDPAAEVRAAGAATATDAELRVLASDRDPDVRAAAIARIGARAPELAARAAADGAAQVRRAAVAVLEDEATIEYLARDDSPEVATAAQVRLAARRGRAAIAIPSLQRIIAAPGGGPERVRIALAWLLAR